MNFLMSGGLQKGTLKWYLCSSNRRSQTLCNSGHRHYEKTTLRSVTGCFRQVDVLFDLPHTQDDREGAIGRFWFHATQSEVKVDQIVESGGRERPIDRFAASVVGGSDTVAVPDEKRDFEALPGI